MFVNVYGQHILVRVFNLHIGLTIFSVCVKQWKGGIGGIGRCPHRKNALYKILEMMDNSRKYNGFLI